MKASVRYLLRTITNILLATIAIYKNISYPRPVYVYVPYCLHVNLYYLIVNVIYCYYSEYIVMVLLQFFLLYIATQFFLMLIIW